MRGAFSLFPAYTKNFTVATCPVSSVSALKYALSSKYSSVQWLGYGLDGPGIEFHYGKEISPMHLSSCGGEGGVSWRMRLGTRINLVPTLRMCGSIPPLPLQAFVACTWTTRVRYERARYRTEKPAEWWNVSILRHCYHNKHMKHDGPG